MRRLLAAHVVAAALSAPAVAGGVELGAAVGVSAPIEDAGYDTRVGFHADAHLLFDVGSQAVALRADALLGTNPYRHRDRGTRVAGLLAGVQYTLPIASPLVPYVLAGLGVVNVDWGERLMDDIIMDAAETRLGFAGGVGVSHPFSNVELFAEVRALVVATDERPTVFLPVTVGVRFGGRRK